MPFADYADFDDCVAQNQDAGDPEAYCAEIKRQVEGKGALILTREEVAKLCPSCAIKMAALGMPELRFPVEKPATRPTPFSIAKLDEAERLVFGWASVAIKDGDTLLTDLQGDQIEPAELERAAYSFTEYHRVANKAHTGRPIGQLVESFVVTPEKLVKMGLRTEGAPAVAHWVGFRVEPEIFREVKAGRLSMFSIEGSGKRVAA